MEKRHYEDAPVITVRPELEPKLTPYVPFYQENILYTTVLKQFLLPYEFTGWKDEQLSWKKTCYLHGGLNPSPLYRFSGSEAAKFLSKYCVNTFINFPIGSGKHCITCNEDGTISSDGVIIRTNEDTYETYWMFSLAIHNQLDGENFDMQFTDLTNDKFLFQCGGPSSLAVLEAATGENLHDIKFMRSKTVKICGKSMRILRMGMAGSLAYELHGDLCDAQEIYDAIYQAGKPFGIRRLGWHTYMMQHSENGFPQFGYHFNIKLPGTPESRGNVVGSVGSEANGYSNPVELGWKSSVKFDHDFVGREALEKMVADPKRTTVSLEWNKDDILDIYASRFEDGEPYPDIDKVNDMTYEKMGTVLHQDKVLNADGEMVGISSGRVYTYYYRRMISVCTIDLEYAKEGTEVCVLWGNPGTRQKKIRAKVARFPYYNENRNQQFDVTTVPGK